MENLKKRLLPIVLHRSEVTKEQVSKEIEGTDLAAVIGIRTGSEVEPIRKEELQEFFMTKDELFRQALKNQRIEGYDLQPLGDVVGEYDPTHTLVLRRQVGMYGAAEILNKDALLEAGERIGSYYIVPSSKHELLLVPKESGIKADDLWMNLQEINQLIPAKDRQSNSIYEYSFAAGKVKISEKETVHKEASDVPGTHIKTERT